MEKEQNKTKEIKDKTIKIKESEDKKLNDELADIKISILDFMLTLRMLASGWKERK